MTDNKPPQLTRDELAKMSVAERLAAWREGRCDELAGLTGKHHAPREGQLDRADLAVMTPQQILAAKAAGRLRALLGKDN